jgi:hypothetical protein
MVIRFIKNNWIMLSLVLLLVASETLHLLFKSIPFEFHPARNKQLYYNTPIYFLLNQFGAMTFIPSIFIFLLTPRIKRASRCIGFGIILWNAKELLEEIFYIFKWDYDIFDPLNVNSSLWGQIAFILSVVLLGFIGFKRWKY